MIPEIDTKTIEKYLPIGVIIFFISLLLFFVYLHFATRDYDSISIKDTVIGKVVYTEKINREKLIMLENGKKFILPFAHNDNYASGSLRSIVGKGDYLRKKAGSDTLIVRKLHGEFLFVIGKTIKAAY